MVTRIHCPHRFLLLVVLLTLSFERAVADDGKHLFILSGQSNMREPLPSTFAQVITKVFGKDKVIFVTVSRPSLPIKKWYKAWVPPEGMQDPEPDKNGSMYDELLKSVKKSIEGKKVDTVTLIWMQGEEDARIGWGSVYEKSFTGVLEHIKRDLGLSNINFVIGRINDYWLPGNGLKDGEVVRATQVKLGTGPNAAWIDTDDLNTGVNPWGGYSEADGHFPPPGYRVMGQRFARKACLLVAPSMQPDESLFKEAFFDSSDDVKSHGAMGKSISLTAPDAARADVVPGLAALLDGRYGAADPADAAWIGLAPGETAVSLIVDLGDAIKVDSIGINLLVSPKDSGFPKKITFSISEDGKTYRVQNSRYNTISLARGPKPTPGSPLNEPKPQRMLVLVEQGQVVARHVKVDITTGDLRVLLDEVIVNPQP